MTPADVYHLLSAAAAAGRVSRWPVEYRLTREGPAIMAALAALGGLHDCDSENEVTEAAIRGMMLSDIGPCWRARYEATLQILLDNASETL